MNVKPYLRPFYLSQEMLNVVSNRLKLEMEKGLKKETHTKSTLKMLPTFARTRPDGTEKGICLGLQLIGTDFKILWMKLNGNKEELVLKKEMFTFPKEILKGTGEQYFDYIAECLGKFLKKHEIESEIIPLGFTLPFPFRQTRIDEGILISLVKDFEVSGVEGKDVVQLLQDAIRRRGDYKIGAVAVLSDSVGVLMSCSYEDSNCEIGIIMGTGTNACYMEEMNNIELVEGVEGQMCVNLEWGEFGSNGCLKDIRTEFDVELDRISPSPGAQIFEKMVSDPYVGEIIRLLLVKLFNENQTFSGKAKPYLMTRWNFESEIVYVLASERTEKDKVKNILNKFIQDASEKDCVAVQQICHVVSLRAISLYAINLKTVFTKIKTNRNYNNIKVTVALDGNIYRHPKYQAAMNTAMKVLCPSAEIKFLLFNDDHGKGAALLTVAITRLAAQHLEINKYLYPFKLSQEQLKDMKQRMRKEMEMGLKSETHDMSSIAMLPSFLHSLPDGSEKGKFLALQLDDLNVRILLMHIRSPDDENIDLQTVTYDPPHIPRCVELEEEEEMELMSKNYKIPHDMTQATGVQFFDHVVDCIDDFHQMYDIKGTVPLGFTFSFPCKQVKLDEAILIKWTKGIKITGCEGKNVVELLREAIDRKNDHLREMHENSDEPDMLPRTIEVKIVALINHTIGTMIAGAYRHPKCQVGAIIGSDASACYMEEMKNIEMVPGDEGRMCINVEWGTFGDNGCLDDFLTPIDKHLDYYSPNPGKQTYEKMISSPHIREIIRHILLDLTEKGILFRGKVLERLKTEGIFTPDVLSKSEWDKLGLSEVHFILENLGLEHTCDESILVKEIFETIINRAGHVTAVGIVAILEKLKENQGLEDLSLRIGVTGDTFGLSYRSTLLIERTVNKLDPTFKILLQCADDRTGQGAALLAAMLSREQTLT